MDIIATAFMQLSLLSSVLKCTGGDLNPAWLEFYCLTFSDFRPQWILHQGLCLRTPPFAWSEPNSGLLFYGLPTITPNQPIRSHTLASTFRHSAFAFVLLFRDVKQSNNEVVFLHWQGFAPCMNAPAMCYTYR